MVDVTDAGAVQRAMERVVAAFSGADIVVNDTGITIAGAAREMAEDDWDRELAINLKGVYLVSSLACGRFPTMRPTSPRRRP